MSLTRDDLCELLHRGTETPVAIHLSSPKPLPVDASFSGWTMGGAAALSGDPASWSIRRTGTNLHVTCHGRDLVRRNKDYCWVFRAPDHPIPLRYEQTGVFCPGALGYLISQHHITRGFPFHLLREADIAPGSLAGRDTWVLTVDSSHGTDNPDHAFRLEIDQEHGVVLAAETARQRVEAAQVEFPDSLPDPAWDGLFEPFQEPEETVPRSLTPAEIPGYLDALPPQSEDPRRLRVYLRETSFEGAFPDYRVGASTRMLLGFETNSPPLPGLETTRRGLVRNLGVAPVRWSDEKLRWPIILSGDGWTAQAHTPQPITWEAELTGWFNSTTYGDVPTPTDLLVERIFAGIGDGRSREFQWQEVTDTNRSVASGHWRVRDVVLDVNLDGAAAPPLQPPTAILHNPRLAGDHLWLRDLRLPVLRGWDVTTGRYTGQVVVPAPLSGSYPVLKLVSDAEFGAVATDGTRGWIPTAGEDLAMEAPGWKPSRTTRSTTPPPAPEVPDPWEYLLPIGQDLFSLDTAQTGTQRCAIGRLEPDGQITIAEVGAHNAMSPVIRVGSDYLVRTWDTEIRFDADLKRVSSREAHHLEPNWQLTGELAHRVVDARLNLIKQHTGEVLPELTIPEGQRANLLTTEAGNIMVLLHDHDHRGIVPRMIARLGSAGWTTTALAESPTLVFPSSSVADSAD